MKNLRKPLLTQKEKAESKIITITIGEKAELVHDREMARQERNRAQESLEITTKDLEIAKRDAEGQRSWKKFYQEQNGKLHNELFRKRSASFCFGTAFGCILSAIIMYIC